LNRESREEAKKRIDILSERLRRYQYEYYVLGQPTLGDQEYDRLFDELCSLEREYPDLAFEDSPTRRVGSDLTNDFREFTHTIPVLSLDKSYTPENVIAWMKKTEQTAGKPLCFVGEEKIDGVSIVLYYEGGRLQRGVTRGNGYVGNDITENVKTLGSLPLKLERKINCTVRGEIYLPKSEFNRINSTLETPYANPRNLAAGTLRRIKSSDVAKIPLSIFVYEGFFTPPIPSHREALMVLGDLGFRVNPRIGIFSEARIEAGILEDERWFRGNYSKVGDFISREREERAILDYEIDGLVFKIDDLSIREDLGYTGHHPRWALAYKFESPEGITKVLGIDVQVGRTGRITPVARVKPVQVGGSTISNVTLHNQDYIDLLELALGDTVAISRRGDVIPAVERVIEKNEENQRTFRIPAQCPSCSAPLIQKGAHHFCQNRECPAQIKGRILFFVDRGQMDLGNLGPETVDLLLEKGFIRDLPDLYSFDYQRLSGIPGFGEKKINLIMEGITKSKEQSFQTLLVSLGIPEVGQKVTELLIENGFDSFIKLYELADRQDLEALTSILGIGEKIARSILREFKNPELRSMIDSLVKLGLPSRAEEKQEEQHKYDPVFRGQTWCVTGSFENFKPRSLAMEEVKKRGGKTSGTVTGKTTHLLAGASAGSKLEEALRLGVKVVGEEEFLLLLKGKERS